MAAHEGRRLARRPHRARPTAPASGSPARRRAPTATPGASAPAPCSPASAPCSTTTRGSTSGSSPTARQPLRVIVDSRLRDAAGARILAAARARCSSTPRIDDAERSARARSARRRGRAAAVARRQGRPRGDARRPRPARHQRAARRGRREAQRLAAARRPASTSCSSTSRRACSAPAAAWPRSGRSRGLDDALDFRFVERRAGRRRPAPAARSPLTPARRPPSRPAATIGAMFTGIVSGVGRIVEVAAARRAAPASASALTIEAPPGFLDDVGARRQHRPRRRLHDRGRARRRRARRFDVEVSAESLARTAGLDAPGDGQPREGAARRRPPRRPPRQRPCRRRRPSSPRFEPRRRIDASCAIAAPRVAGALPRRQGLDRGRRRQPDRQPRRRPRRRLRVRAST